MNFKELSVKDIDLYVDVYNLMNNKEKQEIFYSSINDYINNDMSIIYDIQNTMDPHIFFEKYYLGHSENIGKNGELLNIMSELQDNRILQALLNLSNQNIISNFQVRDNAIRINNINFNSIYISLLYSKEGKKLIKFNSKDIMFNNCITIDDFENKIKEILR